MRRRDDKRLEHDNDSALSEIDSDMSGLTRLPTLQRRPHSTPAPMSAWLNPTRHGTSRVGDYVDRRGARSLGIFGHTAPLFLQTTRARPPDDDDAPSGALVGDFDVALTVKYVTSFLRAARKASRSRYAT